MHENGQELMPWGICEIGFFVEKMELSCQLTIEARVDSRYFGFLLFLVHQSVCRSSPAIIG